ncbi:MAG: DUF952 domain-containing protein [Actinoplanes sp.]
MILHICPRDVWSAAQAAGVYRGDTLDTQGFIHLSTEQQVVMPANVRFRGRTDLLLLEIDESRLPTPLVWEDGDPPHPDGRQFPHLYAALPLDAVVATHEYLPAEDGSFGPPEL